MHTHRMATDRRIPALERLVDATQPLAQNAVAWYHRGPRRQEVRVQWDDGYDTYEIVTRTTAQARRRLGA